MELTIVTSCGSWGGAEVATAGLANRLDERGHRVTLLTLGNDLFRHYDWGRRPGVAVQHVDVPTSVAGLNWRAIWSVVRLLKGDACVCVKPSYDHGNWRLELAPRLRFRRFITVEQCAADPLLPRTSRRYLFGLIPGIALWWHRYRLWLRLRAMGPERIVCVSEGVRRRLADEYRYPDRKLVTVYNGFDVARFQPDPERRRIARRDWGIPEEALVYGAVGRLAPVKGLDVTVACFARLRAERPGLDPWLVLVGEGPERDRLRELSEKLGCAHRVLFPGFCATPWEAHPGLDVFLMPSHTEGLPLALVEAMGSGCCPIAMGVGGIPEVISHPSLGWLVAPGDQEGFLNAMLQVADATPEERARLGERAATHARTHFDARQQFDRIATLLEML